MDEKNSDHKRKYYSVLERQRYEKMQEKLMDQQMKQQEMEEMKEKERQLHQAANMEKEQKQKYLEYMNNNYKTSLDYKREKQREERESELEEERERLKRIQRDLKEEQRRNGVKKATFMQEAQEVENHKRMMKQLESQRKQDERSEYQRLAQQNYQNEVERENNYKRFFKDYESQMGDRIANHMKYVTSAQIDKQNMLDQIEEKNEKEHNDWLAEKERKEKEERHRHLKEMHDENRKIYDKLDQERTHKKEMYQKMVEQRKKEEDDYKDFMKRRSEEEEAKRKLYRESLEYQKGMKEYSKNHMGQMTDAEKRLNNNDLKSYKDKKNQEYQGMIPGINNINSVGSRPILRVANDEFYETSTKAPAFALKDLNRSYKNLHSTKSMVDRSKGSSPVRKNDKYDPITNPIPFVNQNPYIMKEKTMIGGEGTGSLINSSNRQSRRSLLSTTAEKNILI